MLKRSLLGWLAALSLLTGCIRGERALYGSYVAHDMGLNDFVPPVTLRLDRAHRYRFCAGDRCSNGRWFVRHYGSAGDRITLVGPEFEAWWRAFSVSAYQSDVFDKQRGAQGDVEADYRVGLTGVEITLGAGDAAFVKR